jgi:hypothetical protein
MPPIPKDGGFVFEEGDNDMGEDNIRMTVNYTGDGKVTLTLTQDSGKWWKGITSGQWEMHAVQDDRTYSSGKYDESYINGLDFGFSKAKFLGVHTWMYGIKNQFQAGYEYVFHWERDS